MVLYVKEKNIYFLYLFIYEQLKPQITTATLKQMEAKSSLLSDTSVRRDLTILCVKTFVSPYVSAFHSHLCNGPLQHSVVGEGPHGSDYAEQRVKLQREPTELEPSNSHSFTQIYSHIHKLRRTIVNTRTVKELTSAVRLEICLFCALRFKSIPSFSHIGLTSIKSCILERV